MTESLLKSLLLPSVKEFIRTHENDDEKSLILKHSTILGIPSSVIAEQISARRKAKIKLPSFYQQDEIIFPPAINLEQCSSEATARFKADLIKGNTFADLTGGFGIDSFFLSNSFLKGYYIEPNNSLLEIVKHNHHALGCNTITYENTTAEVFLSGIQESFDLIFVDPSRRSASNQKVFKLSDCVPNVPQLIDKIVEHTEKLLIKTSPLLDLQQGLRELKFVEKIVIVSVENECKEVLFLCRKNFKDEPLIQAVNLFNNKPAETFSFSLPEERATEVTFSEPLIYLYEPNASVLKAGAFKTIGVQNDLAKIHPNTHLYTSNKFISDFPGRIFNVESFVKPDNKTLQSFFPDGKANVTTRNYPLSAEALKKKTGLKDGGDKYLIGFSGSTKKFLVVANRLK